MMCKMSIPMRKFRQTVTRPDHKVPDHMPETAKLFRVMGIDPGSVITGYGIIETDGARSFHLSHGHIRVKGSSFAEKLGYIYKSVNEVIDEWQPREVAVEQVFISNNPMSALKLGQARGAAITAVVTRDLPVSEYAARSVKQVVTGTGSADKVQVQTMVRALLQIDRPIQVDAADGLAIAVCHAHSRQAVNGMPARRRTRGRGLRR